MFESWKGYVLACPDKNDLSNILFDQSSSKNSQSLSIKFEKCQGNGCKQDIDTWLKNFQVDMWIIEEKFDA